MLSGEVGPGKKNVVALRAIHKSRIVHAVVAHDPEVGVKLEQVFNRNLDVLVLSDQEVSGSGPRSQNDAVHNVFHSSPGQERTKALGFLALAHTSID